MSTPPFGAHPNTSAPNLTVPSYASTPLLLSPFHPTPERIHHRSDFGVPGALVLQSPAASSLGTYRGTPDLAANREVSRRASAIQILERIHGGAVHRASADDVLHEMHATSSSLSRGEGAFIGESSSTRAGPPAAMGGRESVVPAGSALHEYHGSVFSRIPSPPPGPPSLFSRSLTGSSRLGREVLADSPAHAPPDQPVPKSGWLKNTFGPTESNSPPDLYPPYRSFGSKIASSQSPEDGHVFTMAPDSDGSGTPSTRSVPAPANPPRNWEVGYALQQVIERDGRVAASDGFGGVVTLPKSSSSFPHSQAAIQYAPGPFIANSFAGNSPSWNTQPDERVQIRRRGTASGSTSLLASFLSGPSPSTSTDVSSGGGFGTNARVNEDTRYSTRQFPSQSFSRLTLPTPVPYGQNPSSNPLPRRPYSSGESSAGQLSGPSSTPPNSSQVPPTIASPSVIATRPAVLALGTRAPPGTPAQPQQKAAGAGRAPRKKTHSCWMCHKSFDRPSTLKKHQLVHTGEKAFVCQYCSRRFGVNSNLNRHIKRCPQRPKDASALAGPSSTSHPIPISSTHPTSTTCILNLNIREQVPYSDISPFELSTSTNATVSTLDLHENIWPSSSASASSFYVYPGSRPGPMARSARALSSSESAQASGRIARSGSRRYNQRSPTDRLSVSEPDLPSLMDDSAIPARRPRSNSRTPTHVPGEHAQVSSGDIPNADSGTSPPSSQTTVQPRKRARRPPSPSTWVPESLRNFEIYPAPALLRSAACPLPPVKPLYDPVTGALIEERDSFESTLAAMLPPGMSDESSSSSEDDNDAQEGRVEAGNEENAEPSTEDAFDASSRARERAQARANKAAAKEARKRARLALFAPYHPIGWSGRLPGPAVVLGTGPEGEAVIERAPGGASGSGSGAGAGAGAGGDMLVGADMTNLRFEVITGGPSEGASGSSSRETAS